MGNTKKLQRGLNADLFKKLQGNDELIKLIKEKDHFIGIRNDYFNVYYKGLSLGKFYLANKQWKVEVSKKYLDKSNEDTKNSTQKLMLSEYLKYYKTEQLHKKIEEYTKSERVCQQRIINNNNANPKSNYYCIDMEYVMQRKDSQEKNYGRFDIIAIAKEPNEQGKYGVSLIELKLGTGAMGGVSKKFREDYKGECWSKSDEYEYSLGSGFLGHVANYIRYLQEPNRYNKLKTEIVDIINHFKGLGLIDEYYFEGLTAEKLAIQPEIIFLTYTGNEKKQEVIETAKRYLFNNVEGYSIYNVEKITGYDLRRKLSIGGQEYKFKFYFREGNGEETQYILDTNDQDVFI